MGPFLVVIDHPPVQVDSDRVRSVQNCILLHYFHAIKGLFGK